VHESAVLQYLLMKISYEGALVRDISRKNAAPTAHKAELKKHSFVANWLQVI
jgi:hypothetical protein